MALARQVEEIVLLKCSLLPGELLDFIFLRHEDSEAWSRAVDAKSDGDDFAFHLTLPARFTIKASGIPMWFEIEFPNNYPVDTLVFDITVRGYDISRTEQQRWQEIIQRKRADVIDAEFVAYELISLHLLPLLHEEYDSRKVASGVGSTGTVITNDLSGQCFHALLTSHHLKSPQKRRSLQQWSSELLIRGFAKVGHPGVIYCSGLKSSVEEFVSRVKQMQWLALRVRFVEALPGADASQQELSGSWSEVEKIGEVVNEMRKLGRESYVLDLGIGSGRAG